MEAPKGAGVTCCQSGFLARAGDLHLFIVGDCLIFWVTTLGVVRFFPPVTIEQPPVSATATPCSASMAMAAASNHASDVLPIFSLVPPSP